MIFCPLENFFHSFVKHSIRVLLKCFESECMRIAWARRHSVHVLAPGFIDKSFSMADDKFFALLGFLMLHARPRAEVSHLNHGTSPLVGRVMKSIHTLDNFVRLGDCQEVDVGVTSSYRR